MHAKVVIFGENSIFAAMKKVLFALFLTFCATTWATEANQPKEFAPELAALLKAYEGTAAPLLPVAEKRGDIERDFSVVPGRMFVPRAITVDKPRCRVYVLNAFNDTLFSCGVCASRNRGQKRFADDCRTPEGTFKIHGVYNSTDWTYKDTDSKCYGPFFIHLKTPRFYGIGLHGTNAPGSIPGRSSHGCIRLLNENIRIVKGLVTKDLLVTVLADKTATGPTEAPTKAEKKNKPETPKEESSEKPEPAVTDTI